MITSENISNLQPARPKTEKPASALNPCWCEQCTVIDHTQKRVQRPGFSHWWCDVCGEGPFDRTKGQRPVYQRNVLNANNAIGGIRYACSGECAQSEQLGKLREAKSRKMAVGDLDGAKQITLEVDDIAKLRGKPERKPE